MKSSKMAECRDLQALGKITSETEESHVKIIFSNQCIKAQLFLVDRLRKESGRQKEVCKYISSGNLKLEAEITHAEQEFRSILTANDTIRTNNVEIRKDLLLAQERKLETVERVETGIKKYEDLWLQCKSRYESIPFVQKWFEVTNETQSLKDRIKFLDQEIEVLTQETKTKRDALKELDKKRIIEIANYLMRERPKLVGEIKMKLTQLQKLSTEAAEYVKEQRFNHKEVEVKLLKEVIPANKMLLLDSDWPSLSENFSHQEDTLKMPKLKLVKNDLDMLTVNLEQIKRTSTAPEKRDNSSMQTESCINRKLPKIDKSKDDAHMSTLFHQLYLTTNESEQITLKETESKKFARKKLINILEDISINKKDVSNMISTANPRTMQLVNTIAATKATADEEILNNTEKPEQIQEAMEDDQLEEIDLTSSNTNILIPPTQFLDLTEDNREYSHEIQNEEPNVQRNLTQSKSSQDNSQKRVSFNLPVIQEVPEESAIEANITIDSQMDLDSRDGSFTRMKEMILKKYSLDLSPDFVYEKKNPENIITSKFFTNSKSYSENYKVSTEKENIEDVNMEKEKNTNEKELPQEKIENLKDKTTVKQMPMAIEEEVNMSEKNAGKRTEQSVSGFLFNHGPNGIPDSLDVSISTTGFEDGEGDFAHCIDSSLLLSPKADIPMTVSGENVEVYSQEVPNFLSGLRKTGLSFFGKTSGTESNTDSNANKDGNNFNFNFGSDDKKNRGGLFSMFH